MTDLQALMTKILKRNKILLEGENVLNSSIKSNKITVEIGKSNDPSKDYFTTTYSVEINPEKERINFVKKELHHTNDEFAEGDKVNTTTKFYQVKDNKMRYFEMKERTEDIQIFSDAHSDVNENYIQEATFDEFDLPEGYTIMDGIEPFNLQIYKREDERFWARQHREEIEFAKIKTKYFDENLEKDVKIKKKYSETGDDSYVKIVEPFDITTKGKIFGKVEGYKDAPKELIVQKFQFAWYTLSKTFLDNNYINVLLPVIKDCEHGKEGKNSSFYEIVEKVEQFMKANGFDTNQEYKDDITTLLRIGFRPVYTSEEGTFTIMYSGLTSSVCSLELNNDNVSFDLASPYHETNKNKDDIMDIFTAIKDMEQVPVRDLTIVDLPLLSSKEKEQIMPDKDIATYFNFKDNYDSLLGMGDEYWTKRLLREAKNELEHGAILEGAFESPSMMVEEYESYASQNKKEKERLQKISRLGQMPYGVQTLVANSLQEANEVSDEISKRK